MYMFFYIFSRIFYICTILTDITNGCKYTNKGSERLGGGIEPNARLTGIPGLYINRIPSVLDTMCKPCEFISCVVHFQKK